MATKWKLAAALLVGAGVVMWSLRPQSAQAVSGFAGSDMPGANRMGTIIRDRTNGTSDYLSVSGPGTPIFGVSVACSEANCWCDLYDSATVPTSTTPGTRFNSTIYEIKEDTDEEEAIKMFSRPYIVQNALTISLKNGKCEVYTGG